MRTLRIFKFTGFAILGLAFIALAIFVTMSLWNALIPALFKGPVITFWQTAGLFLLSKILLTGVAPGSHHRNRYWGRRHQWGHRYECGQGGEKATGTTV